MAHYEYFSPALIMLQDELAQHPPAMEFLSRNCRNGDFAEKLAYLCTYCDILVDDDFNPNELDGLCNLVTAELYKKRTGIIVTH